MFDETRNGEQLTDAVTTDPTADQVTDPAAELSDQPRLPEDGGDTTALTPEDAGDDELDDEFTEGDDEPEQPVDNRPVAYHVSSLEPISARAVTLDDGSDAVRIKFALLDGYSTVSVRDAIHNGLYFGLGLVVTDPDIDGNTVTVPMPADDDADQVATSIRKYFNTKYKYAAKLVVKPAPCANCGLHAATPVTYGAELHLEVVVDEDEKRRLTGVASKPHQGVEAAWVLDQQTLLVLPTHFQADDPNAVRRAAQRLARAAGIEIVNIEMIKATDNTDEGSSDDPFAGLFGAPGSPRVPFGKRGSGLDGLASVLAMVGALGNARTNRSGFPADHMRRSGR